MEVLGIPPECHTYRVCIHESADVGGAEAFWAAVVGMPSATFQRATLKRHMPRTTRHNVGETYHGCLSVRVHRSADTYRRIAGIFAAITESVGRMEGLPALAHAFPTPGLGRPVGERGIVRLGHMRDSNPP